MIMTDKAQGMAALSALALLMAVSPAFAQEDPAKARHLTIADCPPGYTLGVMDTAEPQPITRATPVDDLTPSWAKDGKSSNLDDNAVPRKFVTGCIPPKETKR